MWTSTNLRYASPNADIDDMLSDINKSTLFKLYDMFSNYVLVDNFLEQMRINEKPYSMLDHNCQHMTSEVVDFFIRGQLPHWWSSKISYEIVKNVVNESYNYSIRWGLSSRFWYLMGLAPSLDNLASSNNTITHKEIYNSGLKCFEKSSDQLGLSMSSLTYFQGLINTNIVNWIEILNF